MAACGARAATERMRRVGAPMTTAAGDRRGKHASRLFCRDRSDWAGQWRQCADRYSFAVEPDRIRQEAANWSASAPDIILANSSAGIGAPLEVTCTVPIVFAVVADPVGAGFVRSVAPRWERDWFYQFRYGISGKWLGLLKELRPGLRRAAVIRDPPLPSRSANSVPSRE